MMNIKKLLILTAVILSLNSCITLGVAAAAGAVGYYCGSTSNCTGN